eukprot:48854_1
MPGPNQSMGIEDGLVVKVDSIYHLFVTELLTHPLCPCGTPWCTTQNTHWISNDTINWKRIGQTLPNGTGKCDTNTSDAVYWSPLPKYSKKEDNWFMTYVGFDFGCNVTGYGGPLNGVIWLAKSNIAGYKNGLNGKFIPLNKQILNITSKQSQIWWESQINETGIDSFSNIYIIPNNSNSDGYTTIAMYGSNGNLFEQIGMVYSYDNRIDSEWIRAPTNPMYFIPHVENPMITVFETKENVTIYLAIYAANSYMLEGFGFSWSLNGIGWSEGQIVIPGNPPYFRVPMGLIPVDNEYGNFTLFYTDFIKRHNGISNASNGQEAMYVSKMRIVVNL